MDLSGSLPENNADQNARPDHFTPQQHFAGLKAILKVCGFDTVWNSTASPKPRSDFLTVTRLPITPRILRNRYNSKTNLRDHIDKLFGSAYRAKLAPIKDLSIDRFVAMVIPGVAHVLVDKGFTRIGKSLQRTRPAVQDSTAMQTPAAIGVITAFAEFATRLATVFVNGPTNMPVTRAANTAQRPADTSTASKNRAVVPDSITPLPESIDPKETAYPKVRNNDVLLKFLQQRPNLVEALTKLTKDLPLEHPIVAMFAAASSSSVVENNTRTEESVAPSSVPLKTASHDNRGCGSDPLFSLSRLSPPALGFQTEMLVLSSRQHSKAATVLEPRRSLSSLPTKNTTDHTADDGNVGSADDVVFVGIGTRKVSQ